MSVPKEYVLALVAEATTDSPPRGYVSEGLYATAVALNTDQNKKLIVLSSDIMGPTWFSDTTQTFNAEVTTGSGPATKEKYREAVASGRILALDEMMSRVIDPTWRLTEAAAEEMTDFGFLKQTPVLNLLNGFENMMDNVFRSAADLVASSSSSSSAKSELGSNHKRSSWIVDTGILLKDGSDNTSTADVAVGRARRVVALFCYTLIDILKWKEVISERVMLRGLSPFKSMPPDAPYSQLIALIEERGRKFIEGLTEEDSGGDLTTLIPSVTAVLASAVAAAEDGFLPRISGTFYESILGYEIMSLLSTLIAAEYNSLISRIAEKRASVTSRLEKYVADASLGISSENITEAEKRWIKKEQERRGGLEAWKRAAENSFKTHKFLGSAIDIEPAFSTSNNSDAALKALHREVNREMKRYAVQNPVEVLESKVVSARQPLFSNFSVMRVRPSDSAARFSMYVLWNTLFLATGGLTSATAVVDGIRSRLLVNFFLKDLHALFSCTRCEYGFVMKTFETFSIWEKEKISPGEGRRVLQKYLGAALSALRQDSKSASSSPNGVNNCVGGLIHEILAFANDDDQTLAAGLAVTGKNRLKKMDSVVRSLHTKDKQAYAEEGAEYVLVSKGFTALAFYLLYASVATSPKLPRKTTSSLDRAVILLLARWGNLRFPTLNLWHNENDERSSSLLAYAAFWALRNAVRARRNVDDPTNTTFVPGRPLTLLEALPSMRNRDAILSNSYILSGNINTQKLMWKALEELETESEVWSAGSNENVRKARHDMKFNALRRSELVKEPAGVVPTTSSYSVSTVLFPPQRRKKFEGQSKAVTPVDDKGKKQATHPLAAVGQISLSVDDLKRFSKETYAMLPSFPLTPFDI